MNAFEFTIIASGLDAEADDFMDRLYEAGCDDASVSYQKGLLLLEFTREAKDFAHAVISAFENVHKAGAQVERFEPDYLVTLTDIAERTGLSKAAISLYAKGERGKAFPSPVARITTDSPLWDWVDVSRWMYAQKRVAMETVLAARTVREASEWVRTEKMHPHLFAKMIEKALAEEAA
jgi:predicted DNA-binding transcriptional regulator AlpA